MNNKLMFKDKYDLLTIEEKQDILNQISTHYGFKIKEYAFFEYAGISLYTAIFMDEDREFVFIPGAKNVSLGWKKTISGKKEDVKLLEQIKSGMFYLLLKPLDNNAPFSKYATYSTLEKIKNTINPKIYKELDKYLSKETLDFLDNATSYVRKVDIMPMLVERIRESLNWEYLKNIPASTVADTPKYFKIYQNIVKSGKGFIVKTSNTKNGQKTHKFVIDDSGLLVYKHKELNYEETLFQYTSSGYSIPTLNQWEYIASGGKNNLYIDDNIFYHGISQNKPNGFGLFICNNIYEPEIISDDKYIYKGGDGGYYEFVNKNFITYLSLSPFNNTKNTSYYHSSDSGLFARRIISIDLKKKYKPNIKQKNINKYIQDNLKEENYNNIVYAVNSIKYAGVSFENAIKIIEIYHNKGFINKSLEIVELFQEQGKNNPEFLYLAGYTYFRLSDMANAIRLLNNAIQLKRNMPECYQLLSYIYFKNSENDKMNQAFYNLSKLSPEIANSMIPIIFPKGFNYEYIDYDDLWNELLVNIAKENENKTTFNITDTSLISELILIDSTIKLIINKGIKFYIKDIRQNGSVYLFKIFDKIESSKYLKNNNNYLSDKYWDLVWEEFQACKNILHEAETIELKKVDDEYLQNLTNSFFDYSAAFTTLAYIHYSNCRIFEAQVLFDTEYSFCSSLYQTKQLPIELADNIRVLLENFVSSITMNVYTYGDIWLMIENIIEKYHNIRNKYIEKYVIHMHIIEKNFYKDLSYILKWFKIDIDLKYIAQLLK